MTRPVQPYAPPPSPLQTIDVLRAQIDAVDDALLDLVIQRTDLARAIARAKAGADGPPPGIGLRPARETSLLRRLVAASAGRMEPHVITEVWRALMSANLQRQGAVRVVIAGDGDVLALWDLARAQFGGAAVIERAPDIRAALLRAAQQDQTIALAPWPAVLGRGAWWTALAEQPFQDLVIAAALPIGAATPGAALVARLPLEPAGDDRTLVLTIDSDHEAGRRLAECGLVVEHIDRVGSLALAVLLGFCGDEDPRLARARALGLDGLRVVGAFARF
jgi:chorismate mutase/prephenate dehydratase